MFFSSDNTMFLSTYKRQLQVVDEGEEEES